MADNGISETPAVAITPTTEVLSGTELWLDLVAPPAMEDYSTDSSVTITDGAAQHVYPMDSGKVRIPLDVSGASVGVESVLRDRSGNSVSEQQTVNKLSYFADDWTLVQQATSSELFYEHLLSVPGLAGDVVWVENRLNGGYRILGRDKVYLERATGKVT